MKSCWGFFFENRELLNIHVYGVGLVGSQIVLHLLANGTPPKAIRIVDAQPPSRPELLAIPASEVAFIQADVRSSDAVNEAFTAEWSSSVASLPLTVFHTAAIIEYAARSALFYDRCASVNVVGTAHVLAAAKAVGAGVLIYTSSSIVAAKPVGWFFPPWKREPRNYVQTLTEKDFFEPLPSPEEMPSNYARSKAEAERLVCNVDDKDGMRTGAIRPGNAVYGSQGDPAIGRLLKNGRVPSFIAPWVQNWAHSGNVALAHLQYEDALLGPNKDQLSGRPFVVTDDGPPLRFKDLYHILSHIRIGGFIVQYPPPLLLLLLAYALEAYTILIARVTVLQRWFAEPTGDIRLLQPGTFVSAVNCIIDDSLARKSPEEGGFGYRSACTSVEGMCAQVMAWNELVDKTRLDKK